MFYCSLPISYRWGQTNKNSIGGDRRTKFNRLGQTNKSSIGGDRRTVVQRYKNKEWGRTILTDERTNEHKEWGRTVWTDIRTNEQTFGGGTDEHP